MVKRLLYVTKYSCFYPKEKNTFPIYNITRLPRLGTIGKNHIQSSSNLFRTALFLYSESDTFLMNYIKSGKSCSDVVGEKIAKALKVDIKELIEVED